MVYVYPRVFVKTFYDASLANAGSEQIDSFSCSQDEVLLLTNISAGKVAGLMLTINTNDNITMTLNLAGADNLTEKGMPFYLLASQTITLSWVNSSGSPLSSGTPGIIVYRYIIIPRSIIAKIIWQQGLVGDPSQVNSEAWIAAQYHLKERIQAGLISPLLLIDPNLGTVPSV